MLSQLASINLLAINIELDFLDTLGIHTYNYTVILIEVSPKFKDYLLKGYQEDPEYH